MVSTPGQKFPFFTALITLVVIKTIVLYFVLHYGSKDCYFYTYWSLDVLDTMLQLCVVYEIASRVFRPLDVWAHDVRGSYAWLLGLSLLRSVWSDLAGESAGANLDGVFRHER